jgi:hypothetical protein
MCNFGSNGLPRSSAVMSRCARRPSAPEIPPPLVGVVFLVGDVVGFLLGREDIVEIN